VVDAWKQGLRGLERSRLGKRVEGGVEVREEGGAEDERWGAESDGGTRLRYMASRNSAWSERRAGCRIVKVDERREVVRATVERDL
jgi:hypothetical protein